MSSEREFVQSLAKGLAVIEAFSADTPAMTLSEVARKTGLAPGSARRVLITLERLGYVGVHGKQFVLLPRTLRLGYAFLTSMPLASLVQPILTQLTQNTGQSSSLAMLDGGEMVIVARATAPWLPRDYMTVGGRLPAHAGSLGKALLSALSDEELDQWFRDNSLNRVTPSTICDPDALRRELEVVRTRGWAFNDQESMVGLRSLAVPVHIPGDGVVALGFSAPVSRVETQTLITQRLPILLSAAESLSDLLKTKL